ncbi:MAG: carbohydrate kinase family protein [Candidatus Nomurabacteria bacterium]|jgi:ribokinase|nr:carbohydrate kinase family protein [Candidatus Nomurabacteria bacterium]
MKNLTFLTAGAATQDIFLSHSPEFVPVCENPEDCFFNIPLGAKINVNKIDFATGGGATNAATTFARNGHHALFMGAIGRDPAGAFVIDGLDKEGIDTSYLSYNARFNTGVSVLLLAPNGERTILTYRGASTHYRTSDFDLSRVEKIDWLYISSLNGHFEILDPLFRSAKEKGAKIAFNPGKSELAKPEKLKPLLADVEILIVNKEEAQQIVSGDTCEELLMRARNFCPVVVITDGANGAWAIDRGIMVKAGLYDDSESVDRTGAGDSFGSGFTLKYASGASLKDSVHFASANASSVVAQIGAKAGILNADSVKLDPMDIKTWSIK